MRNPQTTKVMFGVVVVAGILLLLIAAGLAMHFAQSSGLILVTAFAVVMPALWFAWVRVLLARCPQCGRRAFLRGSIWFGSSWGALGSKCVHCGSDFDQTN